jgi:hypothetical protein
MLATLRCAQYGYLLAFHIVLLCAAGHTLTDIACGALLGCGAGAVDRDFAPLLYAAQNQYVVPRRVVESGRHLSSFTVLVGLCRAGQLSVQ